MNTIITVTFGSEFAIWQAADTKSDDTRPFQGCVRIHPAGYLMATNGTIAAIVPCEIEGAPEDWAGAMVNAAFIKELLKQARSAQAVFTICDNEAIGLGKTGKFTAPLVEGYFPDLLRILKGVDLTGGSVSIACINPSLLVRVGQAVGHEKDGLIPHYWAGPEKPVTVLGSDRSGAIGMVMPGSQQVANALLAASRDAIPAIIARLSGEPRPVKQAA